MDNELSESIDLGVEIIFAVVIVLITALLCRITKQGFIQRDYDINYQREIQETFIWKELQTYELNNQTYTDIDSMLKWLNVYDETYQYCIFVKDNTNTSTYHTYTNKELTPLERAKLNNLKPVSSYNEQYTISEITEKLFNNIQALLEENKAVEGKATVIVFPTKQHFSKSWNSGVTEHEKTMIQGQRTFKDNYVPSVYSVIVFIIE